MAEQTNGTMGFPVAAAVTAFRRVKLDAAGRVAHAGASDYGIGVAQFAQVIPGLQVAVRSWHEGSLIIEAAGAITAGEEAFAASAGRIAATGTLLIGTIYTAASGAGSVVEVFPHLGVMQSSSSISSSSSSSSSNSSSSSTSSSSTSSSSSSLSVSSSTSSSSSSLSVSSSTSSSSSSLSVSSSTSSSSSSLSVSSSTSSSSSSLSVSSSTSSSSSSLSSSSFSSSSLSSVSLSSSSSSSG
jgi:hypothetical protein